MAVCGPAVLHTVIGVTFMKKTNIETENLKSINKLFNYNKSNIESLIKDVEKITGDCILRGRATSERTYFAYERTYLKPEEKEEARKLKQLPNQENNTDIKIAPSTKAYYREVKTNKSGYIDAHIENIADSLGYPGEKYYHLMTADESQSFFITKFYDRPIATICFTDNNILYVPAADWVKVDKKTYIDLINKMGDTCTGWGPYNESVYMAVNKNARIGENGEDRGTDPFKSISRNLSKTPQYSSKYYIGRPNFRGYTGPCASYKNGEKANKALLCVSPLMGEEALSESSYAKSANIGRVTVTKSILAKGYFYNKKRGDIAIDSKHKELINQMYLTIAQAKEAKSKYDIFSILVDFIISQHADFNKKTVGIRTARRECDFLEELESWLSK